MQRDSSKLRRRIHTIRRGGFTFVDVALTTAIVSFGMLAMMSLLANGTKANMGATELTTGTYLANNIHELALGLKPADAANHWGLESGETKFTCDDVEDLDGQTFSPPVDARRISLTEYTGWSQCIVVTAVDEANLNSSVTKDTATHPMATVKVTVTHNGTPIYTTSWLSIVAQ